MLLNVWGLLALPLFWHALALRQAATRFDLVVPLRCEALCGVQLELPGDPPRRFQAQHPGGAGPRETRLALPAGQVTALVLRLQPRGEPVPFELGDLRIEARATGRPLLAVPAAAWREVAPGQAERTFACKLEAPVWVGFDTAGFLAGLALDVAFVALAGVGAWMLWRRRASWEHARRKAAAAQGALYRGLRRLSQRRPLAVLWLGALAGVLLSCYPIVFGGRSFVSPNLGLPLLYPRLPTLPGYTDATRGDDHHSDVDATMLAFLPYAMLQHRAIFHDGELPLWNRANAGGVPLLGQGQSMVGDPLHWLPILANGAAWAWDLKQLLAKLVFAGGIGLAVLLATRHLPAAALLAFSSCFIGFFVFRLNHSTFFSVCYAPWILYAWLQLKEGGALRHYGLLLLANWMELSGGAVKESCILLVGINAAGLWAFLLAAPAPGKWRRLAAIVGCGVGLGLVSAPLWLTLLDTLTHAWNSYQVPAAWQIQPGLLIGLFDDIYYRQFNADEGIYNPGLNFVVLLGLAFGVAHFKRLVRDRAALGLALGALPAAAVVFGLIPSPLLRSIPFVGNIVHADSTFSCVLIVLLPVLAGFGWRECWRRLAARDWLGDAMVAGSVLAVLLGAFLGLAQARQSSSFNPGKALADLSISPFCWVYTSTLMAGFIALPLLLRQMRRERGTSMLAVLPWLLLSLGALTWRHGLHLPGLASRYVMSPGVRAHLQARSAAVDFTLARQREEPGRTIGVGSCLAPGFNAVYGLENPSGPDALQNPFYHALLEGSGLRYWCGWYLVADRPAIPMIRKFLDLLNVRFYLDTPQAETPSGLRRLGEFDLAVFQSDTAWPRAFFTGAVTTYQTPPEFYQQVAAGDGRPFVTALKADLPAAVAALPADQASRQVVVATDYRVTSNTIAFRVDTPGPGVVALLEGFQDQGAEFTLDGAPVKPFRLNVAFNGIYVPAGGEHTVRVARWPRHFTAALGMSALGVALLIAMLPVLRRTGQTPARATPGPAAGARTTDAP